MVQNASDDDDSLRPEVYRAICDTPGVTAADIARELDVHYETARYHLDRMAADGTVERHRIGGHLRFFGPAGRYDHVQKAVLVAQEDVSRAHILRVLSRGRPVAVSDMAERIGLSPSTASVHLRRLKRAGLVRRRRRGMWVTYALTGAATRAVRALA